jgi:hypothetical protein
MTRRCYAALWGASLLVALTARAAGDPRPCLGACRLTFGKCIVATPAAATRERCLRAYAECSKRCHDDAGTTEP